MAEFTKAMLQQIRVDMKVALAAVEKKHGITFRQGNITYLNSNMTMKIEASMAGGPTKEQEEYDRRRGMHRLPVRGTLVQLPTVTLPVSIVGWKGRSAIVASARGERYKINPHDLAMYCRVQGIPS